MESGKKKGGTEKAETLVVHTGCAAPNLRGQVY